MGKTSNVLANWKEDKPIEGDRIDTYKIDFPLPLKKVPTVLLSLKVLDFDHRFHTRYDMWAESITTTGFQLKFKTCKC